MPKVPAEPVRVAAAQAASAFLDRDRCVDKACQLIEEAGREGAALIAFPEGFIPGHPVWFHWYPPLAPQSVEFGTRLFENAVEVPSPATDRLCEAATEAGTWVVMGVCERRPGTTGTLYNSLLFINERGQIAGHHRKLMPTIGERLVHAPGAATGLHAYASPFGRVSGLICGENSNPLSLFTLAAESTLIHTAAWPPLFHPPVSMRSIVELASRSFSYTAKAYVTSVAGTLDDEAIDELDLAESKDAPIEPDQLGGSLITAPNGQIIAGPLGPKEELLFADVDPRSAIKAKLVHDFAGHYNRPDVFQLRVSPGRDEYVTFGATVKATEEPLPGDPEVPHREEEL